MPFQLLDLILAGIMLVSGLLALMRGFTREVLSLVAWGAAAVAALAAYFTPELRQLANQYLQPEIVATIALCASAFLIVLVVMSLVSVKLADLVLDSAAGPVDRTLGFIYGLGRGLLLVVIAYLFYVWLIPPKNHEDWIRTARSQPMIESVGQFVISFLPPDIAETLKSKTYIGSQESSSDNTGADSQTNEGYKSNARQGIDQLIQSTQGGRQGGQSTTPDAQSGQN